MPWSFYDKLGQRRSTSGAVSSGGVVLLYDSGAIGTAQATLDSGTMTIPSGVNHLRVVLRGRVSAVNSNTALSPGMQFNGDTGSHYRTGFGVTGGPLPALTTAMGLTAGNYACASSAAGVWTHTYVRIPFAQDTSVQKNIDASMFTADEDGSGNYQFNNLGCWWNQTAAVNRIAAVGGTTTFIAGSRMIVYGEA